MNSNASYEQILTDFSTSWNTNSRHNINRLIEASSAEDRSALAVSLLRCDFEKRLECGEQPQLEDYLSLAFNLDSTLLDWHSICIQALSNKQQPDSQATVSPARQDDPSEITILKGTEPPISKAHDSSSTDRENGRFGRYKLIRRLGKGGMGEVWLAEQQAPVLRWVAIKLALNTRAGEELQRRFQRERQALAILAHPNIANIFDAGTSADGLPFFVMEFVDGKPITQFCDEQTLTLSERLSLFLSVCSAIQHAHQKGLIHRDLKPSNVLVSWKDGQPFANVIDFGLVKSLSDDQRLDDRNSETESGTILGTLQYMSPEQADPQPTTVDARSDIYSLGALLYEILTGSTPLEEELAREQSYLGALQTIVTHEPLNPSRRVQQYDLTRSREESRVRKTNPKQLSLLLKGELDWIVMKALDKEPHRRYRTVNDLAHDIESYLNGDIVTARAPSLTYRARKFAKRHRVVLSAVALVSLLALIPLLGINWLREQERERVSNLQVRSDQQEKRNEQQGIELAQSSARANIQLALNQWSANQIKAAHEYLDRVPEAQRKLTWGIAKRMLQGSLVTRQFMSLVNNESTFSHNLQFAALKNYKEVVVVDVEKGENLATLPYEQPRDRLPNLPVLITNDGKICVLPEPKRLLVIDVSTKKNICEISLGTDTLSSIDLSSTEKRLAIGTDAGEIHLFDFGQLVSAPEVVGSQPGSATSTNVLECKARLTSLPPPAKRISHLQFQDGDAKLMFSTTETCEVFDLTTSKSLWKVANPLGLHNRAEYCPTGTRVFTADLDGRVTVWDLNDRQETTNFATGKGSIESMAVSPNGQWLACVSEDQVIRVYDARTGKILREYKGHSDGISLIRFSADSERLISVAGYGEVKIWPTPFHRGFPLLAAIDSQITEVLSEPKTQRVLIGTADGAILCWDRSRHQVTSVLSEHIAPITSLALSTDGRQLASSSTDGTLVLWDLVNNQIKKRFKGHAESIVSIALSSNGDRLLSADEAGVMRLWNTETGKSEKAIRDNEAAFTAVEFCADDSAYVVADDAGRIRIWSKASNKLLFDWEISEDSVTCMSLSRDGKFLFTGGMDGKIYHWDIQAKKVIKTFSGHSDSISDLAVSPTGDILVSSSADGSVRLWDVESGVLDLQFSLGRYEGDYSVEIAGVALDVERNEVLAFTTSMVDFLDCGLIMSWDANWEAQSQSARLAETLTSDVSFHRFMLKVTDLESESVGLYSLLYHSAWCFKIDPTAANYVRFHNYYEQWALEESEPGDMAPRFLPEAAREALLIPAPADLVAKDVALKAADRVWERATATEVDVKGLRELAEAEVLKRSADQYELERIHRTLALLQFRTGNFGGAIQAANNALVSEVDLLDSADLELQTLAILTMSLYRAGNKPMAALYYEELQGRLEPELIRDDPVLAKLMGEMDTLIPKSLLDEVPPSLIPGSPGGMGGGGGGGMGGGGFF
jgi:eukaryotic-like serine/threonine-protein kinase